MIRPAGGEAIKAIGEWAQRAPWRERLDEYFSSCIDDACAEHDIDPDEIEDVIGPHRAAQLEACVIEAFLGMPYGEDGLTIADDYLKRRGWQRSAGAKRYLQGVRDSTLSLWEVVGIKRGSHFEAVDLFRGGPPQQLQDVLGSKTLHRWDRLLARVFKLGDRNKMAAGILLIEHADLRELLEWLRKGRKELDIALREEAEQSGAEPEPPPERADDFVLACSQPMIIGFWLRRELERALAPPPQLVNAEGEDLEHCELRFPLLDAASVGRVTALLDADPALRRQTPEEPLWGWLVAKRPPAGQCTTGESEAGRDDALQPVSDSEGRSVVGIIELGDQAVILTVNSRGRADRGRTLIAGLLGALVGEPSIKAQPVDLDTVASRGGSGLPPSGLPPEEEAEAVRSYMNEHFAQVLSEPIPMLGGETPRAKVSTEAGRREVAEWLKYMENLSSRSFAANAGKVYDFAWMWDELGIADLQR